MKRRDVIIIAVLINAGLLTILGMLAFNFEEEQVSMPSGTVETILEILPSEPKATQRQSPVLVVEPLDEVDRALKEFENHPNLLHTFHTDDESEPTNGEIEEPIHPKPTPTPKPKPTPAVLTNQEDKFIQVKVKRGDSLDKIAKAHGISIAALKEWNQLKSDRLSIGQSLRVQMSDKKSSLPKPSNAQNQIADAAAKKQNSDSRYYTVKSGDSLSKIAKQMNLKTEDLMKLNHLDEASARNLKIGDQIRTQ